MHLDFYVYKHVRLDTNTTFYVGKGRGKRAIDISNRNNYWNHVKARCGFRVEFIAKNLTEQEAYDLEFKMIRLYKRYGRCETNLESGGGNPVILSEETRLKMSKAAKARVPWNKGKKTGQKTWNKGKSAKTDFRIRKSIKAAHAVAHLMPAWNKGVPMAESSKAQIALSQNCQPFRAINRHTKEIAWEGLLQTDCLKALNLGVGNKGNLNSCLKRSGTRKFVKDYIFHYLHEAVDLDAMLLEAKKEDLIEFEAYDPTGKIVYRGYVVKDCLRQLRLNAASCIHRCLSGECKQYKGFTFKYLETKAA